MAPPVCPIHADSGFQPLPKVVKASERPSKQMKQHSCSICQINEGEEVEHGGDAKLAGWTCKHPPSRILAMAGYTDMLNIKRLGVHFTTLLRTQRVELMEAVAKPGTSADDKHSGFFSEAQLDLLKKDKILYGPEGHKEKEPRAPLLDRLFTSYKAAFDDQQKKKNYFTDLVHQKYRYGHYKSNLRYKHISNVFLCGESVEVKKENKKDVLHYSGSIYIRYGLNNQLRTRLKPEEGQIEATKVVLDSGLSQTELNKRLHDERDRIHDNTSPFILPFTFEMSTPRTNTKELSKLKVKDNGWLKNIKYKQEEDQEAPMWRLDTSNIKTGTGKKDTTPDDSTSIRFTLSRWPKSKKFSGIADALPCYKEAKQEKAEEIEKESTKTAEGDKKDDWFHSGWMGKAVFNKDRPVTASDAASSTNFLDTNNKRKRLNKKRSSIKDIWYPQLKNGQGKEWCTECCNTNDKHTCKSSGKTHYTGTIKKNNKDKADTSNIKCYTNQVCGWRCIFWKAEDTQCKVCPGCDEKSTQEYTKDIETSTVGDMGREQAALPQKKEEQYAGGLDWGPPMDDKGGEGKEWGERCCSVSSVCDSSKAIKYLGTVRDPSKAVFSEKKNQQISCRTNQHCAGIMACRLREALDEDCQTYNPNCIAKKEKEADKVAKEKAAKMIEASKETYQNLKEKGKKAWGGFMTFIKKTAGIDVGEAPDVEYSADDKSLIGQVNVLRQYKLRYAAPDPIAE